jgi:signal transduction histidine kinase
LTSARALLTGLPGLLGVTSLLVCLLLLVGWFDQRATRRELLGAMRAHAEGLRETIDAAARANEAASQFAEAQVRERLRDNARLLAALDAERTLDAVRLEAIARDNALFRIAVFDAAGERELSVGPGGYGQGGAGGGGPGAGRGRGGGGPGGGPGAGPGPGGGGGQGLGPGAGPSRGGGPGQDVVPGAAPDPGGPGFGPGAAGAQSLVRRVLDGEEEAIGELHAGRRAGAGRLAVAVKRPRGGVILVNADASAVLQLQQQSSLDTMLADIAEHATDVAYVLVQTGGVTKWAGTLPSDLRAAARDSPASALAARADPREVSVDGRPVMEFAGPVTYGPGGSVRLGMRLDATRAAERRLLVRLVTSLAMALLLGAMALAFAWIRQRYGTLSIEHARAQEALKRRDRLAAMGELASTVAHEIRNPLNAIAMSAQRLDAETFSGPDADEGRSLVGIIQRESARIDTRIQQFLAFARPPALVPAEASLAALVDEVGATLRPSAELRGVTLRCDTTRASTATIDVEQMRQVVDNLVRNAIEATPPGGVIELRAASAADGHLVVVRDSGPGIPPDDLPRIFDLYFTTKTEGTGVGLAVSQQIVTAHGGRIDVDSSPDTGTTFTVVLPSQSQQRP